MEFEWDEAKSERNRIRRGLPFRVVIVMFEEFTLEEPDLRRDYGELRIVAVGRAENNLLTCVYTDRAGVRRIISLRRANKKERHAYHQSELGRH